MHNSRLLSPNVGVGYRLGFGIWSSPPGGVRQKCEVGFGQYPGPAKDLEKVRFAGPLILYGPRLRG